MIYGGYVEIGNASTSKSSILAFNPDIREKLLQAKRPINPDSAVYKYRVQPVVLIHFSDVHANKPGLERVITLKEHISDLIDDTLCTGDMAYINWSDGYDYWSNTAGSEDILVAIGNHDVGGGSFTQAQVYERYMAPVISNWGVTYTAGLTYYYKDYAEKKLRLVVLNCMLTGADNSAQLDWFTNVLTDARTKGYTVVASAHYFVDPSTKVACNYTNTDRHDLGNGAIPIEYIAAVGTHIDNSGKFACWLTGHSHQDAIVRTTNYHNQFCIIVDCTVLSFGNQWGNMQRTDGTRSQDVVNITVIDTDSCLIKLIRVGANIDHNLRPKNCIVFNYNTGEIVTQS